jgi:DNA-binding response OmpR family regulator
MTDKKKTILLVEDDNILAEMYTLKFQEDGLDYLTAADGEAGLALAKEKLPDIILLDIMMPKMDGFMVLIELRNDATTKAIPVIMLSNLGQNSDIEKGKKLGANDYIVKASMTPAEVVEKIKPYIK